MKERVIAHMDMDAFFAAVEVRDNPLLRGKPVIIGADPREGKGRGVVSTCSYEARKFNVHSALPISKAYQRCPHGVYLRGDHKKYRDASRIIFKILKDFTPDIQPISIDEAFMDLSGCCHFYGSPLKTCEQIRVRVKEEVGLNASIGIAPNKMVAKIASDYCKPDGLIEIRSGQVLDFLWPLPIGKIWGVGKKAQESLAKMNIISVGDLAKTPVDRLVHRFGLHGEHLHRLANGIDHREVQSRDAVKSVSHEHTFETDTDDKVEIMDKMLLLCERVSRRLRKQNLKGKTITVKLRLSNFKTFSRAQTLSQRVNFSDVIYKNALTLIKNFYQPGMYFRLIGVRISNFEDLYVQDSLYEDSVDERDENLHKAFDTIKDKYGETAIRRVYIKRLRSILLISVIVYGSGCCYLLDAWSNRRNDPIVGEWEDLDVGTHPMILTFNNDQTYIVDYNGDGQRDIWGRYQLKKNRIRLADEQAEGSTDCYTPGLYYYTIDDDKLVFDNLADQCRPRKLALNRLRTRVESKIKK